MIKLCGVVLLAVGLLFCVGCESKPPPEASKSLQAAMKALKEKDVPGFIKQVVPDQRKKIDYGKAVSDSKVRAAPLAQLMAMEHFSTFERAELSEEAGSDQTDTSTSIAVTFWYKDNSWFIFYFEMKKQGAAWLIDMKSSVERAYRVSGNNAFSAQKLIQ